VQGLELGYREYINVAWGEKQNKRFFLKFGVLRTIQFDKIQIHTDVPKNFFSPKSEITNFW
jgi:hypothetical protein